MLPADVPFDGDAPDLRAEALSDRVRAPAFRRLAARIRASVLVKILSPLIAALFIGSVVTAIFVFVLSGRTGPVRLSVENLLILGWVLVAAATGLSWLTARRVIRPLAELSRTAGAVAAGNLDVHFAHASQDEIGQLASALETMTLEVRAQLELIGSQTDALREASLRITSTRDEERRRLARDLHDGLQGQLVVLQLKVGMAAERVAKDPAAARGIFAELGSELERILDRVREVSHDLYPSVLRDLGLSAAVRSQASRIPISTRVTLDPDPLPRLARDVESSAYFILSEAVANVLKHAQATELAIALAVEDRRLTVTVADNGIGFQNDADGDRRGLTHMDDRIRSLGGDLFITTGGSGTVLRASLPLDPARALDSARQGVESLPGIEQVLVESQRAGAFVGREREIEALRLAFEEAAAGKGGVILISGEAGIGKTRAANELATYASSRGAEVLVGRCYDAGGAPAFWPWIQVLRAYVRGRSPDEVLTMFGSATADVAQILPELGPSVRHAGADAGVPASAAIPGTTANDPRQARFRLFDSIASVLRTAAAARPLLVVLDDLQSADTPSLRLLEFLAHEVDGARLLIVGTHRTGMAGGHPLDTMLASLQLALGAETIALSGLDEAEVARFIELSIGTRAAEPLLAAVYRQTEGNPLFVREVVRLLASEGRLGEEEASLDLDIPQTVRQAIGRRIEHLPPGCIDVLAVAATIGREFDLAVLQRASGIAAHRVSAALEEALTARVLIELPRPSRGGRSFRFNHALTRETIYASLSPRRRTRLHRRIAEALEATAGKHIDPYLAELAHHYRAAGRRLGDARALEYATRAGERAASLLAFEESARHYERALRALDAQGAGKRTQSRRCDLLIALGESQWRAGDTPAARESFTEAAAIARDQHDAIRLAAAAVGFGAGLGAYEFAERADQALVGLLDEALAALDARRATGPRHIGGAATDEDADRWRVRVLARLAVELYYTDQVERRAALSKQAVELAERLSDPASQVVARYSLYRSMLGPDALEERLAVAEEIVALGERSGDRESASWGRYLRLVTLLEKGDREAVDAGVDAWVRHVQELRQPLFRWQVLSFQTLLALMEGRFDDAETSMKEALVIGRLGQGEAAEVRFGAQTFLHHWGHGRLSDMEREARKAADAYPWLPGWRTGLAVIYSELQRPVEARAAFEALAKKEFADIPRDGNWLGSMAMAAVACSYLHDVRRAATLYKLMIPYEQRCVVVHAGGFCLGSAATFLGMLAAMLGRLEEASRLFKAGLAQNEALRAGPMAVVTMTQHAAMLTSRNGPGDATAAITLSSEAMDRALAMGMGRAAEIAGALQVRAQSLLLISGSAQG